MSTALIAGKWFFLPFFFFPWGWKEEEGDILGLFALKPHIFFLFLSVLHTKNEIQIRICLTIIAYQATYHFRPWGYYTYFDFFKESQSILARECDITAAVVINNFYSPQIRFLLWNFPSKKFWKLTWDCWLDFTASKIYVFVSCPVQKTEASFLNSQHC